MSILLMSTFSPSKKTSRVPLNSNSWCAERREVLILRLQTTSYKCRRALNSRYVHVWCWVLYLTACPHIKKEMGGGQRKSKGFKRKPAVTYISHDLSDGSMCDVGFMDLHFVATDDEMMSPPTFGSSFKKKRWSFSYWFSLVKTGSNYNNLSSLYLYTLFTSLWFLCTKVGYLCIIIIMELRWMLRVRWRELMDFCTKCCCWYTYDIYFCTLLRRRW